MALFFDNPSDASLTVGRSDNGVRIVYAAETGPLRWYFLIGRDLRGVMREVAELLGRAPLPPRWALGFLQSTRHFEDTAELRALAPHDPREAHPVRRADLPLVVRGGARLESRRRASRVRSPSCARTRPA